MTNQFFLSFFLLFFLLPPYFSFSQHSQKLILDNEFIRIIVNDTLLDKGRFAIETTQGDPANPDDDEASLIFGRPLPWTSYTTLLIDGIPYVFGGKNPKLFKRSGKTVRFGTVLSQEKKHDRLITRCQFGSIIVTQTLRFFRSTATRVNDAALISYQIENQGTTAHQVGLRMMLDTKLGQNDGAPFRLGNASIESEIKFEGDAIYDYWQAFDSFSNPKVISQGTLKDSRLTKPDRLYLANWGILVDSPWDFDYQQDRSFVRTGEIEKDTSLALYWDAQPLSKNQKRTISTAYGLGGVSLSPGELSLGLSCPEALYLNGQNEALVMGYLLNSGGFTSKDTKVTFTFPEEISLVNGKKTLDIGLLAPHQTVQIPLKIKVRPGIQPVKGQVSFSVSSSTLNPNQISQPLLIISPPQAKLSLFIGQQVPSTSVLIPLNLKVKNPTDFPIYAIETQLQSSPLFEIPSFQTITKSLSQLSPHQSKIFTWLVHPKTAETSFPFNVNFTSDSQKNLVLSTTYDRPPPPTSQFNFSKESILQDDYFYIDLEMYDEIDLNSREDISIQFSSQHFSFIRLTPAPWLRKKGSESLQLSSLSGMVSLNDLNGRINHHIGKFHFKALQSGVSTLTLIKNNVILLSQPVTVLSKLKN